MAVEEMGYRNVAVYREGLLDWARGGHPLSATASYTVRDIPLLSSGQLADAGGGRYLLLDIRPAEHFVRGHIAGSRHIDLEDLHLEIANLPRDRNLVLVDHKGKLTLTTGRYLADQGFPQVYRLDGGFNAWVKAGLQVTRGN